MSVAPTVPVATGSVVYGPGGYQHYGAGLVIVTFGSLPLTGMMVLPHYYHRRGRAANIDDYLGPGRGGKGQRRCQEQRSRKKESGHTRENERVHENESR
jgi:hypothetical protein